MAGGMSIEMWLAEGDDSGRERDLLEMVWDEFAGQDEVDTSAIAVRVTGHTVTVSGTVPDHPTRIEAERAAKRVPGVRTVVNELVVSLPPESRKTDEELTNAVRHALRWDVAVPTSITTAVTDGCVTLDGEVSREYEREAADRAVAYLRGVRAVANRITLAARRAPDFEKRVHEALTRDPGLRGDRIAASVHDGTVVLEGRVRCLAERDEAEHDVRAVPGVTEVQDHIAVP